MDEKYKFLYDKYCPSGYWMGLSSDETFTFVGSHFDLGFLMEFLDTGNGVKLNQYDFPGRYFKINSKFMCYLFNIKE